MEPTVALDYVFPSLKCNLVEFLLVNIKLTREEDDEKPFNNFLFLLDYSSTD
jgi:hypothetical protein